MSRLCVVTRIARIWTTFEYAVSADFATDTDPVQGGAQFIDELPADEDAIIRVWGDAALALLNGDVAGIQLEATAGEPGTVAVEGGALTDGATNTDLGVENVFADAGNDGVESQTDGFNVVSAELTVTKAYAVVDGDLGSGLPIPGATIEYTITVANASTTAAAEDVLISDEVDITDLGAAPIVLNIGAAPYNGNDIAVFNGGLQLACDIETNGDGDGCDYTDPDLSVGAADLAAGIDVAAGATLTIQYQVVIPDPDPTP